MLGECFLILEVMFSNCFPCVDCCLRGWRGLSVASAMLSHLSWPGFLGVVTYYKYNYNLKKLITFIIKVFNSIYIILLLKTLLNI